MKKQIAKILPWIITAIALYFAFRGVDWDQLKGHVVATDIRFILLAFLLTCCSYPLRTRRWQFLFPKRDVAYFPALKVLILGFFMNNILPARTGEFVRAHLGSKVTGATRTLVLATIASERLVDGLAISLMFIIFAVGLGKEELSTELLYVAYLFGAVAVGVATVLLLRNWIFNITEKLKKRYSGNTTQYILGRIEIFIEGLAPLFSKSNGPLIALYSIVVWSVELAVFISVSYAYGTNLSLQHGVLFMVAVNFSSLIPSGPGGFGVIEFVTTQALVSIGLDKEVALAMVLTQHVIQYIVVGIPGAIAMLTWKGKVMIEESESGNA